ncbi:MAG: laccase domain-containing protein, partial [Patescibacteria group bacterium]
MRGESAQPPQERKNLPAKETNGERIENGVWIPGSLAEFSQDVAIGSTTKKLEQFALDEEPEKPTPRLRVTADAKRVIDDRSALEEALKASGNSASVDEYRGKKVVAGLILGRLVKRLDPEADLHRMIKTRLVHGKEIVLVDEAYLAQPKEKLASIVADGLITQMEHIPLLVAAADCAPVFVYDPVNKSMGMFHSG